MSEFKVPQLVDLNKKDRPSPSVEVSKSRHLDKKSESSEYDSVSDDSLLSKKSNLSDLPEQQLSQSRRHEIATAKKEKYDKVIASLPYREPLGSSPADSRYSLEVIKEGSVMHRINFNDKKFFTVGRIPGCDITAENPTVSRIHAILQFIDGSKEETRSCDKSQSKDEDEDDVETETQVREKGLYIFDLNSTHGTYVNKNRLYPNRFYRLRVGHVIKFGNSTRLYIVEGPDDDEEVESDKTVSELLKERLEKELEKTRLKKIEEVEPQGENIDEGITWGMPEDAQEDTESRENPFAMDFQSSELSLDNPKKTLRGWFEREGYDLEYDVREKAAGHFICRVDLPLDGPQDSKVFAEVELKGKKKDVVHQCALQACQILDKYGVLRQSHHESRTKRKNRDWADEDYYSSDEDTFLDRTGTIEKKREKRMKEAGQIQPRVETYETLFEKSMLLQRDIDSIKKKISKAEATQLEDSEVDPLDAFMADLKTGVLDVKVLKSKLRELLLEQGKIKKLQEITKPAIDSTSLSSFMNAPKLSLAKASKEEAESSSKHVVDERETIKFPKIQEPLFDPKIQIKVPAIEASKISQKLEAENSDAVQNDVEDVTTRDLNVAVSTTSKQVQPKITPQPTDGDEDSPRGDEDNAVRDDDGTEITPLSNKKPRIRMRRDKKTDKSADGNTEDPNYSVWVPPSGQSGDGRTSLNDKLGY